jgi:isoleucyl-tRNA synthetase
LEEWLGEVPGIRYQASGIPEIMKEVRRLASLGLAERTKAGIKVRQPLQKLEIRSSKLEVGGNKKLLEILKDEVNVKEIVFNKKIKSEVELDTVITAELKEEGILRELARAVQDLRQKAGLRPQDEIVLMVELPSDLREIVLRNEKLFKREVEAKALEYKKSNKFKAETNIKIEGQEIWVAVRRV